MNLRIDVFRITMATALLGAWALVGAHDHEQDHGALNVSVPATSTQPSLSSDRPQSYFGYSTNTGLIYAHIAFMVVSWMFVLPLGTLDLLDRRAVSG